MENFYLSIILINIFLFGEFDWRVILQILSFLNAKEKNPYIDLVLLKKLNFAKSPRQISVACSKNLLEQMFIEI